MSEETRIVLCLKMTDGRGVVGSEIRWCHICAVSVWVSPEGLKLTGDVRYSCDECFIGLTTREEQRNAISLHGSLPPDEVAIGKRFLNRYLNGMREQRE